MGPYSPPHSSDTRLRPESAKAFGYTFVVLVGETDRGLYEDAKKKTKECGNIRVLQK